MITRCFYLLLAASLMATCGCSQANSTADLTARATSQAEAAGRSSKAKPATTAGQPVSTPEAALNDEDAGETVPVRVVKKKQVPAPRGKTDVLPNIGKRSQGVDWPSFLGPNRNSSSPEKGIITDWSAGALKIVWQQELGSSYGIGTVSKGRYFQFDEVDEIVSVQCYNAETGKKLWQYSYTTDYADLFGYDSGPRCSPVVDGNRVYIFGVEGKLICLRATDGAEVWEHDLHKRFGVVQNFFGVGATPVIEGDLLLVMVGGSPAESSQLPPGQLNLVEPNGSAIVAFDKYTGEVKYKLGDDLASYASPLVTTVGERRWGFLFAREGLIGFDPAAGTVDFHYKWRATSLESVNAATPVVVGDEVFISETYGPGSTLLKVKPGGYDVVWKDNDRVRSKAMQTHWNTPVAVDGYLYASSGRHTQNAELRCIEWKTGKVQWTIPRLTRTSLLYVDGHFLCLGEYGSLILFKANPNKFEPVGEYLFENPKGTDNQGLRAPLLLQYPCWAAPIISHGLLYLRGSDRLLCVDLIPED